MFVQSIIFKRMEYSNWEKGYYIGETDNCDKSVILDSNYKPLEKDENGCDVWDYKPDIENPINIRFKNN